jgi:hypothetical protein
LAETCHDTFLTDYVPSLEKKCETTFDKNCKITYKAVVGQALWISRELMAG